MINTNFNNFLLKENIKNAKKILSDLELNPDNEKDYKEIEDLLKKNHNLIANFTKYRYIDLIDMDSIKVAIKWILNNKPLIKNLPKNLIEYKDFEKLTDDLIVLKKENLIKQFYNQLYREMKEHIDNLNEDKKIEFDDLVFEFMKNIDDGLKKEFFKKLKYFRVNNLGYDEFIESLKNYINKNTINVNKIDILNKVKKLKNKIKIKYYNDDILILQTNDKKSICELGSDSWCIVYASDSYHEQYTGNFRTQYIIYNFNLPLSSRYSMFGVTLNIDGKTVSGGSQDKFNSEIPLDKINNKLNIPNNIIVPDEDILKRKKDYDTNIEKIKNEIKSPFLKSIYDYVNDYIYGLTNNNYYNKINMVFEKIDDYDIIMEFDEHEKIKEMISFLNTNNIKIENDDDLIQTIGQEIELLRDGIDDRILDNEFDLSFNDYKKFYDDNYLIRDIKVMDYKYQIYFERHINNTFSDFISDDDYIKFLEEYIKEDIDIDEIGDILSVSVNVDNMVRLYNIKNDDKYIKKFENDIDYIFVYNNSDRITKNDLIKKFRIKTVKLEDDSIQECFVFNDFTDLDDYYENSPFEYIKNYYDYNEPFISYRDDAIESFVDYADVKNTIHILDDIIKEYENNNDIKLDKDFIEKVNQFKNGQNDIHKEIKSEIKDILNEYEDEYYDTIQYLKNASSSTLDDIYQSEFFDNALNEFINTFSGKPIKDGRYYEFIKNEDETEKEKWELYISIDIDNLLSNLSYENLEYELGTEFEIKDLLSYYINLEGLLSVDDDIYPTISNDDKDLYNEALLNQL